MRRVVTPGGRHDAGTKARPATLHRTQRGYDAGRIVALGEEIDFIDLTSEQVPLLRSLSRDPERQARLAELVTDWAGGPDPLQRRGSYVGMLRDGELSQRIRRLEQIREKDAFRVFKRGAVPLAIGGYNLNMGEEREISGLQGSGTVYLTGCSMRCLSCQYADLALERGGERIEPKELARVFLELQDRGAHNLQLMTPSHLVVELVKALQIAAEGGLVIPLVYNTGGFEDLDALKALDGIVDIYLPDVKFGSNAAAKRYAGTPGYWDNVRSALREMHRQVGDIKVDARGVAYEGVLVRHLVLPNDAAESKAVGEFLASISRDLLVHVMGQYRPEFAAARSKGIDRPPTAAEIAQVIEWFKEAGLSRGLERKVWGV